MRKIFFPLLHPLLAGEIEEDVLFLNPGIVEKNASQGFYTPERLPLSYKESKRYLGQLLQYGEMFKTPGEISQTFLLHLLYREEETLSSIKSQIKRKKDKEEKEKNYPFIGQLTLLLQWLMEENVLEIQNLNKEITKQMKRLNEILGEGVAVKVPDSLVFSDNPRSEVMEMLPWKRLLPWFFLFVEETCALFVNDNGIIEEWIENGLEIQKDNVIGKNIIKDKGWKFLLKKRSVPEFQWLNKDRIIIIGVRGNF